MDESDDTLNKKLQEYKRAIDAEFSLAESATPSDLTAIRKNAAESFLKAVPRAVERILYLMEHADKDTVQLSSAKFVVQSALAKEGLGEAGDPLAQLINELTKPAIKQDTDSDTTANG